MKTNKNFTPFEVEATMQEARNGAGFVGDVEKLTINNIVEQARVTGRQGDKIILVINPMYVHIPFWQRNLRVNDSIVIGANYIKEKWELPKVYLDNGVLKVADGMHRCYGAFFAGISSVTMEFLEVPEVTAIELFLNQTTDRKRMSPSDVLRAALAAKKPEWIELEKICHDNHISIRGEDNKLKNAAGTLTTIYECVNMCKYSPEKFDSLLKLIYNLQWGEGAYGAKVIRNIRKLYGFYGESKTNKILLVKCAGRDYFKKNIVPRKQELVFDYLSNVIINTTETELAKMARKEKVAQLKKNLQIVMAN